jgi:hypothetical protein
MTGFACLILGTGLGMALDQWLHRNRPWSELEDVQDTLDRARVDLHNARAELALAERYTAALLDDPGYYVSQRNEIPAPEKWGR